MTLAESTEDGGARGDDGRDLTPGRLLAHIGIHGHARSIYRPHLTYWQAERLGLAKGKIPSSGRRRGYRFFA